jgi:uncharacterized membrane protein (UPF0127 family)
MVIKKALILLALIFLIACTHKAPQVEIGDAVVSVELAITAEEQAKGLMHRESMDENAGMLFVFTKEKIPGFWMKNTLIPLDMIFIGSDNKVKEILVAEPCKKEPCVGYKPKEKVMYVLEVNKGFTERHNVSIGDEIKISI